MQIQAPVPSLWSAAMAGGWQAVAWDGAHPREPSICSHPRHAPRTSPCVGQHSHTGAHTFNHKTRAKPISYLLLPFASVHGAAVHPTVPLLYLRVCGCGWMDRKTGD